MNERIKQMITERGMYHDSELYEIAEAVVRECAEVILNNDIEKQEDYGFNHPYFGGWERGVIDSAQVIKKHFGVKE